MVVSDRVPGLLLAVPEYDSARGPNEGVSDERRRIRTPWWATFSSRPSRQRQQRFAGGTDRYATPLYMITRNAQTASRSFGDFQRGKTHNNAMCAGRTATCPCGGPHRPSQWEGSHYVPLHLRSQRTTRAKRAAHKKRRTDRQALIDTGWAQNYVSSGS